GDPDRPTPAPAPRVTFDPFGRKESVTGLPCLPICWLNSGRSGGLKDGEQEDPHERPTLVGGATRTLRLATVCRTTVRRLMLAPPSEVFLRAEDVLVDPRLGVDQNARTVQCSKALFVLDDVDQKRQALILWYPLLRPYSAKKWRPKLIRNPCVGCAKSLQRYGRRVDP